MSAPTADTAPVAPPTISAELRAMFLDQLDRRAPDWQGAEKRQHDRHPHRVDAGVMVVFTTPHGSERACMVHPRNVSAGGIAFLDEVFAHRGTPCAILLRTLTEDTLEVSGHVVDCRLVHGRLHEVAVVFNEAIDVRQVAGDRPLDVASGRDAASESSG